MSLSPISVRIAIDECAADTTVRHSLLRACLSSFKSSLWSAVLPRLCLTAFTFFQPFLLNDTVALVDSKSSNVEYGKALIGAWALTLMGIAVSKVAMRS